MQRAEWFTLGRSAQIGLLTQLAYGLKELHSYRAVKNPFRLARIHRRYKLNRSSNDNGPRAAIRNGSRACLDIWKLICRCFQITRRRFSCMATCILEICV